MFQMFQSDSHLHNIRAIRSKFISLYFFIVLLSLFELQTRD